MRQGGTSSHSLTFCKAKKEVKKNYFDLVQIKNSFAHFWKIKMNIKPFFCRLFFDVLGRFIQVFKKILIFKVPVIF